MGPDAGISGVVVFIVLVTNRVVVRDLEVLTPPNSMVFRHASFWTCPRKHFYQILSYFSDRLGFGVKSRWSDVVVF